MKCALPPFFLSLYFCPKESVWRHSAAAAAVFENAACFTLLYPFIIARDMAKHLYKEAVLWAPLEGQKVRCNLCHWRCTIAPDGLGRCHVRKNIDGRLCSLNYDKVCAANVDPIEKKPLFHFQPGSQSFSIAAAGCNFRCVFCQNWQISQAPLVNVTTERPIAPKKSSMPPSRPDAKTSPIPTPNRPYYGAVPKPPSWPNKRPGQCLVSNGYMTPRPSTLPANGSMGSMWT